MSTERLPIIERAYELARSGEYATVSEIKQQLDAEGYANIQGHLYGSTIVSALRRLCEASAGAAGRGRPS